MSRGGLQDDRTQHEACELGRLAACYGPSLQRRAVRLLRDVDEARDLVQETYARALERSLPWLSDSHALGWLCSVLHNLALDKLRARRRRPQVALQQIPELSAPSLEAPEHRSVEREQLCACAACLPPALRDVYRLHDLEGVSYREIAAQLHIPLNTVGTRLRRARRRLRDVLLADESASGEKASDELSIELAAAGGLQHLRVHDTPGFCGDRRPGVAKRLRGASR